nr:choice-of-anchor D domain-containing protein [Hymenobacter sp. 15J16-1T3B]
MSGPTGTFAASPPVIGSAQNNNTAQQTITATIPTGTAGGTGYRVRVTADNPAFTSSTSSTFTVAGVSIAPTATQNIVTGANGTQLTATTTGSSSARQWVSGPSATGPFTAIGTQTGTTYTPNFSTVGTYFVAVQSIFACGTVTSNTVQVNVADPAPAPTISTFTPDNGVAGTPVTITGTDFTGATAVTFNGVAAASYTVNSATSITATAPASVSTGPLAVTTPGGTATSATSFTVNNPIPSISSLSPNTALTGATIATLTINGSSFVSGATVTFAGTAYTATFVNAGRLTVANVAVPATAGTYDVTVTNPAPGGGQSAAATFTVNAPFTGLIEDFETGTKTGYPAASVTITTGSWTFSDALLGTDANDKKTGSKSARLRGNASIAMDFDKASGAGVITLYAASYGSDSAIPFVVEVSNDGGNSYTAYASASTSITGTLTAYTFTANVAGPVRVRVRTIGGSTSTRVNIDDLSIADFVPAGAEISVKQTTAGTNVNTGNTVSVASAQVGAFTDLSFTITNLGSQPLVLGTITAANAEFALTGADPSGSTVAANGTVSVTVRFAPTAAGPRTGSISIPSNDATDNENPFVINFTGIGSGLYYAKATGDLNDPTTFGINADGSGMSPVDFTSDGQVFNVTGTGRTISANLAISGSGSKLVLAPNASLIIPAAFNYTGPLDLGAGSTLVMQNSTVAYTLGTIDASSTVEFAQSGTFVVPTAPSYGNLKLTGGTKTLGSGTLVVRGNFTVDNVTNFNGASSPFTTLSLLGNFTSLGTVTYGPVANGFTLQLDGTAAQTLAGNGSPISLYRLINNNTAGAVLTAAGNTTLVLGNTTTGSNGGGLVLTAGTTLTLNSNTITLAANATSTGTGTIIGASAGTVNVAKSGAADPGTLYFGTGETLGTLTLAPTGSGDELTLGSNVTITTLNLTSGVLGLNGKALTLSGPVNSVAGQLRGSAASSLTFTGSGSIGALDFVNTTASLASLVLNRTTNDLISLTETLTVGNVTFTGGSLSFSGSTRLTVTGTVTGGTAISYTNAMTRQTPASTTTATLSFPLGGALGFYRPVSLALTQSSSTSVTGYTARIQELTGNGRGVTAPLTNVSGIRYFSLAKETGGASFTSGTVTLSFGEDDGVNDAATLRLARSSGPGTPYADLGSPTVTITGTGPSFLSGTVAAISTALGDISLATDAATPGTNPLPVVLTDFTARAQGNGAMLEWTTAQEKNSAYFEVLRSIDGGREFEAVGRVQAAGHSSSARQYTFLDARRPGCTVYYRLRQVDLDGTATLSSAVALQALGAEVTLYPNPTSARLALRSSAPVAKWQVEGLAGQVVLQGGSVETSIDVTRLPAGTYSLNVTLTDGTHLRKRFVKQ